MKRNALLTVALAVVLGSFSAALASSPSSSSSCAPDGACAAPQCCEITCAGGESVAAAEKRVITAELSRLVSRYVADASLRTELLRTLKSDPERALEFVALAKARFSEADRAAFKRVSDHFKC
ncbi:MAG TPA: hypothetical protein VHO24_05195 [Opitutaceae bacterium]|nr:hypothetical protein [Opitutaceae bacterium]